MYQRHCVKCNAEYTDEEDDDYYCPPCLEEKKAIAKQIDEKIRARGVSKRVQPRFDQLPLVPGTSWIDYKKII